MWIVMALATRPWHTISIDSHIYATNWLWFPALMLFTAGIVLYAKSGKSFTAKQLAGLPEIHRGNNDQRLITTGIRARVRHPVYLAHLCEMLAWSVGTGLAICWALTAFAIVTGAVMIRMEDTELEKRFGAEYAAYRSSVPAILPRVFRPRQL
jgi:protein-S-isoprenylcysteine O-methyltransferase Ste14